MLNSKNIAEIIYSRSNLKRIQSDKMRYEIYNGKLREYVETAIRREFILPETVSELINRIIPINITQKIVNKLAGVYINEPKREAVIYSIADQEAIDQIEDLFRLNVTMKHLNRMFKLCKMAAIEPFLYKGKPSLRCLPAHTFTLIGEDLICPEIETIFIKHISMGGADKKTDLHAVWSESEQYTMNGEGEILPQDDYVNAYGVIPFVVIKDTPDLLMPIQDDDLLSMQIAINLLLTDLAFATKYQAWSLIYLIGAKAQNIKFNPNSVISLDYLDTEGKVKPEIGMIKPTIDIDGMLKEVEALLSMLLTTKSLSVNSVSLMGSGNVSSGVAKILDSAESTEDRQDQIAVFSTAERSLFNIFTRNILPIWKNSNAINPIYELDFSFDFELSVSYPDMSPPVTEKDEVEIEKMKVEAGLTSKRESIKKLNPEKNEDQIDALIMEIKQDETDSQSFTFNQE